MFLKILEDLLTPFFFVRKKLFFLYVKEIIFSYVNSFSFMSNALFSLLLYESDFTLCKTLRSIVSPDNPWQNMLEIVCTEADVQYQSYVLPNGSNCSCLKQLPVEQLQRQV